MKIIVSAFNCCRRSIWVSRVVKKNEIINPKIAIPLMPKFFCLTVSVEKLKMTIKSIEMTINIGKNLETSGVMKFLAMMML